MAQNETTAPSLQVRFGLVLLLFFSVAVVGLGFLERLMGMQPWSVQTRWVIIAALVFVFLYLLGKQATGRANGVLIDNRFKMSLARFQILAWTWVVFSALTTIALERNRLVLTDQVPKPAPVPAAVKPSTEGVPEDPPPPAEEPENPKPEKFQALNISLPPELLLALGISTASVAGAALIRSNKSETVSGRRLELVDDELKAAERKTEELKNQISEWGEKAAEAAAKKASAESALNSAKQKVAAAEGTLKKTPGDAQATQDKQQGEKEKTTAEQQIKRHAAFIEAAQQEVAKLDSPRKAADEKLKQLQDAKNQREGLLHRNEKPGQAQWSDMFRGDLVSNFSVVDVAKIQMFFFTLVIVATYSIEIWALMGGQGEMPLSAAEVSFPAFDDRLAALLALSHAGYLTVKNTS